jgi:hypothetical protein
MTRDQNRPKLASLQMSLSLVLGMCLAAGTAMAHHSFNMFDMETTVTLEGRVIDFDYVNPHGWISVETTNEQGNAVVWEVETISALIMRRRGIDRDSLAAGEWVSMDVHPARNPERLIANGEVVRTLDGKELVVGFQNGNPALEIDSAPAVTAVATGLEGTWRADSRLADVVDPARLAAWPLTEKAKTALAAYDGSQNPWVNCVPYSSPVLMLAPLTMRIEIGATEARLFTGVLEADRVVYLDGRGHPADQPPSNMGHSVGRWEGDELVIETSGFAPRDLGLAFGIPSGSGKRLTERLSLSDDGTYLDYLFAVFDPDYLTAPVLGRSRLHFRPDLGLDEFDCDPESARRFLDVF